MAYRVAIQPRALKQIEKLDHQVREPIRAAIRALGENPRPHGYKKLKGQEGYRIRVENKYRVLYEINDGAVSVIVIQVGHRREVYER